MKRILSVVLFSLGLAMAAPVTLGSIPVTVEAGSKVLTLSETGIRSAYPSAAGRPDAVFQTEDRKVTVAFEWRDGKLAPSEVEKLVTQFPAIIKAQVPNIKTLKANMVQIGGKPWAQFVFTTPGKADDLRREMLITSVGGRIMVMTIAGNLKDYSRNEATVRALANSVHINAG